MKVSDLKEVIQDLDDNEEIAVSLWDCEGMKVVRIQNIDNAPRLMKTKDGSFFTIGHAAHCAADCPPQIY